MPTAALALAGLLLILLVSRALATMLERARQPAVMAEVLAGIVLGASVLGAVAADAPGALFTADARALLTRLGEVAIVAYVFTVGAELDPARLRRDGGAVTRVAVLSFVVPWLAGAALALALHPSVDTAPPRGAFVVFLGTALAVTAFPVLARIVAARGLGARRVGRVALGAAAAQELLVWPGLAVAVALAGGSGGVGRTLVAGAASIAAVVVLARVVVPAVVARAHTPARGVVVLIALAASAAATQAAGLHLVLGAFLLGAALPAGEREVGLTLLRRRPLRVAQALLLPLFFAIPALSVDLTALTRADLGTLGAVLAVAATAKLVSAAVAARAAGLPRREALAVGALMNARGLVELVVLSVGREAGLIDDRLFTVMVAMALVTTFAAGPLVERIERGARRPEPHR